MAADTRDGPRPPVPRGGRPHDPSLAIEENLQAISAWEQSVLHKRSRIARLGDTITAGVASGPVLLGHAVWFVLWPAINVGLIPVVAPFDPFPFPLFTMVVSLEAIFLSLLVLSSQNRMSIQTDKRAHLNLQVDLLAEREMTAMLRLLMDIAGHLGVPDTVTPAELGDLVKKTDIHQLTVKLDAIPHATESAKANPGSR